MKTTALALVLIAGGAIGMVLPVADEAPADPAVNLSEAAETQTGSSSPTAGWAQETALRREQDGHFYADVTANGANIRMLVDTGATVIALTGDDASAMGLYWDDSEVRPVAQGASGPVLGVNTSLERVEVGGFEARNVAAMIIPEGLSISLLGQSFLSSVNTLEIADDRMVLRD